MLKTVIIMQKEIHYFYLNLKGKNSLFFLIIKLKALFILKELLLLLNKYDLNGKYIHHGIWSTAFHLFYYLLWKNDKKNFSSRVN